MLNNNSPFKPDFGLSLSQQYKQSNSKIVIVDAFFIRNLIMFPDGKSSITAEITNMVATFDFDSEILREFLYMIENLNLISPADTVNLMYSQKDEPVMLDFYNKNINLLVTGMVLTCKFGQKDKSTATSEEFLPLIIEDAKIVQEPVAIVLDQLIPSINYN